MSKVSTSDYSSVRSAGPWAVFAVAALSALSACQRAAPPVAPPAMVMALPVRPDSGGGAGDAIRYPVEAVARYSNAMAFRVGGKLIERDVRLGDSVRRGQVIARLDPADSQKQAASAKAVLDAAEHRLTFARQQLDRDQAQFAQNLIAANQLEQTQDAYAAAVAGREESAAQLVVAQNTLQYDTLFADHDGVISSENADTGQVVSAGQAVYGLTWTGETDADIDAAAGDVGRIAVGQAAIVTFAALPGRRFEARVREVAPAADPQSRTYRVKLTLIQPGPGVLFGMTGDAFLAPGRGAANAAADAPVFKIPATAIFHQGKDPAVWVIRPNDSMLELRPVTVARYSERAAMVTAGLRDGDSIVLAGVHTVYAGEHVKAVKPLFDGEGEGEGKGEGAQ
ncbi:MAG TPA: efflux RND transporter periplasmic adaptor subunit [Steroidobacteraceae bacterium]|nr:efflux RND transporter periplasmic adaptor subunit [Steroidobacteraceae bacterium]